MFRKLIASAIVLLLLACSPSAHADERIDALEGLADKGHPKALYHLGMMYLTGTEVEKDQKRAVKYFEQAHELGDPLAAYKLGCFYDGQYQLFEIDLERALTLKLVAARAGYALAQQDVAGLYARQENFESALKWLESAASQGTAGALATYASVHNGADGIPKDPVKTAAYFRIYMDRVQSNKQQREWLGDFESKLSPAERRSVDKIVSDYRAEPTPLTIEALSGLSAVDELLRTTR